MLKFFFFHKRITLAAQRGTQLPVNIQRIEREREKMEPMLGGIYESRGPENSLEIEELAKFAIDDHNTKANALLEFHRVVNTKEQIVAGKMFYITLEAIDGGVKKVYEAKVWTKGWENFKQVQEFNYVADAPADGPSS